jgi:hypothetical protein
MAIFELGKIVMAVFGILPRSSVLVVIGAVFCATAASANPSLWKMEWGKTDFTKHSVEFSEIMSGGPPKDGIPSIDDPKFVALADVKDIAGTEPVIGFSHNGDARAYPLRILIWHEIVNDTVGGLPITVTYCPLCNSAIVFDRRLEGRVLDFGTTGKLRKSDLVMYDRQTESWWQQFIGEGIVGEMTGKRLKMLPARVESLANFRKRFKTAKILVPNHPGMRAYGRNPYAGYDSAARPFLFRGEFPKGIKPMAYVVAVGKQAWPLELIRRKKTVTSGDLRLSWSAGQNSALDSRTIESGRDLGNVVVQKKDASGWRDAVHDLTFAFVFHTFVPDGVIHKE